MMRSPKSPGGARPHGRSARPVRARHRRGRGGRPARVSRSPGPGAACCGVLTRRRGRALARRGIRLLLDEFQDTDPIQIELAVLIAADPTVDITGKAWHEIETRPGNAFPRRRSEAVDLPVPSGRYRHHYRREHLGSPPHRQLPHHRTGHRMDQRHLRRLDRRRAEGGSSMSPCRHIVRSAPGPAVAVLGADTAEKLGADELRPSRP